MCLGHTLSADPFSKSNGIKRGQAGFINGRESGRKPIAIFMMDGVSGNRTPRAIREYERAHGLPADGQIRSGLLTTMSLARAGAFY